MWNRFHAMLATLLAAASIPAHAWTPEYEITTDLGSGRGAYGRPCVAFDSTGRMHCIYTANPSGESVHIYYKYKDGNTWSPRYDLPSPNYKEPECDMAVDSNNHLHVVGTYRVNGEMTTPYTVYYWEYNGSTWSGPTMISSGQGDDGDSCSSPKIAVDRNNDVHVVWSQNGQVGGKGDIMYRKRQNVVWQAIRNISNNSSPVSYSSSSPDIAVDRGTGNNVHIVWHDEVTGVPRIYYVKSPDLGATWPTSSGWTILNLTTYGKAPSIVLDNLNNPNVWWTDRMDGTNNNLAYSRWTGSSWTVPANWGIANYFQDADFDSANVMRFLYTTNPTGTLEFYYRTYDYSSFSTPELVSLGANTYKGDFGSLALDSSGYVHVVWEERKDEGEPVGHVYYSTNSSGAPGPVQNISAQNYNSTSNLITWTNPTSSNFYGTMVRYKKGSPPTGVTDGFLLCDRPAAPGSTDSFIHNGAVSCSSYFYTAFAHDAYGQYSAGVSTSAPPLPSRLSAVKTLPDGLSVDVCGMVVTAVFSADGAVYVEEQDRTCGIRVSNSGTGLAVGDIVSVYGTLSSRRPDGVNVAEREIASATITKTGVLTPPLEPLYVTTRDVGGASVPPLIPGIQGGTGLNNMGLLVQVAGRVSYKVTSYIYVDDGWKVPDISGRYGVMVRCPSSTIPVVVGDMVKVTGIVEGSIPSGWTTNRRYLHIRDWNDLVKLN